MSMTYSKTNWTNGIAPAISATNLGNIETFNAAVAAAAGSGTRSALGTLDADTAADAAKVSAYGIGVLVPDIGSTFSAAFVSGLYKYGAIATGPNASNAGNVLVLEGSITDQFIAQDGTTNYLWHGYRSHGTGVVTWKQLWDALSDGNGGQPPAPKPTSSSVIGQWVKIDTTTTGNYYANGTTTAGGAGETWKGFMQVNTAAGAIVSSFGFDAAGSAFLTAVASGQKIEGFAWRTA